MKQITKEFYSINVAPSGNWRGNCPQCSETIIAKDVLVSQKGLVSDIQKHELETHGNIAVGGLTSSQS